MNERHARPSAHLGRIDDSSALRAVALCCRITTGLRLRLITCCPPDKLMVSMPCFLVALPVSNRLFSGQGAGNHWIFGGLHFLIFLVRRTKCD